MIGRAAQSAGLTRPAWLPALDPDDDFPRTPEGLAALLAAAGFLEAKCSEVAWDHETGAEEWWAGAEQGIGAIGQVLNSRGPERMAEARRAYDGLSAEFRTRSGQLVLPHVALLAAGTA